MLSLEDVKSCIQVDFDEDDKYISLLINGAYEWLEDTTGFDFKKSNSAKAEIICLAIIKERYEHRDLTMEKAGQQIGFIMKDMLIKLCYEAKKRRKENVKVQN